MAGMSMFEASLMVGGVSDAVRQLEHELKYYRDEYKIAQGVIEQLHRGFHAPGKPVYIHPADFAVLIQEIAISDIAFVDICKTPEPDRHVIRGVQYIVTPLMPKYTKKFD